MIASTRRYSFFGLVSRASPVDLRAASELGHRRPGSPLMATALRLEWHVRSRGDHSRADMAKWDGRRGLLVSVLASR